MTATRRSLLVALGTLPLTRRARGQVAHRLTVLHLNDFHSRHEAVDGRALTCGTGAQCFGGSARLAAALLAERRAAEADGRAVLVLDAGDQFQGSLFFTAHRGMAELAVQHAIGVDAMVLGNHEFDAGPEVLGRYVAAARFPVLAANVDASDEPALTGRLRRYAMFERGGIRVGVVGVTTTEALTSSSPGPRVRIGDPAVALATAVGEARAAGAQLVIALSHLGVLADATLGGVAVVVGGHSHTLLSNTEAGALGPHPSVSPGGALVVQAGAYGRYAGRLDLDLAADGSVLAYGGAVSHVGLDAAEDPAVAEIVAVYAAPLAAVRRTRIGVLAEALPIDTCRFEACAFGTLVAEAMLRAAHGAEFAVMNAGGLRTGLASGPLTLGDVLDAMPFGNTLATFDILGADLEAALEHGRAMRGRGGFLQVAGRGPIDPGRVYRVATNNFLRTGGDGFVVFRDRALRAYDAGPSIAEITAEALAMRSGRPRSQGDPY